MLSKWYRYDNFVHEKIVFVEKHQDKGGLLFVDNVLLAIAHYV